MSLNSSKPGSVVSRVSFRMEPWLLLWRSVRLLTGVHFHNHFCFILVLSVGGERRAQNLLSWRPKHWYTSHRVEALTVKAAVCYQFCWVILTVLRLNWVFPAMNGSLTSAETNGVISVFFTLVPVRPQNPSEHSHMKLIVGASLQGLKL